jgi:TolB protein
MDLDSGGTATAVTDTTDDESPSFAPNGRLIVYATRSRGASALMTTTLDGKIKARLVAAGRHARAVVGAVPEMTFEVAAFSPAFLNPFSS